jgi:DNA repair exonuclease SbcCD ATPase subunit
MTVKVVFILLLGICLSTSGCQKKTSVPTPRQSFREAEQSFDAGDYARAAQAYEAYLRDAQAKKDRDKALFRLALAYSAPDSPVYAVERSVQTLRRLIALHPGSSYLPAGRVILSLQEKIEALTLDLAQLQKRMGELALDLAQRQTDLKQMDNGVEQMKKEIEKLKAEIQEREAQVKLLNNELRQLKTIDLERRPARPPR